MAIVINIECAVCGLPATVTSPDGETPTMCYTCQEEHASNLMAQAAESERNSYLNYLKSLSTSDRLERLEVNLYDAVHKLRGME